MICTIAEFVTTWQQESAITARVLAALTDASLAQRVSPQNRTLGELAWHITTGVLEMPRRTGLEVTGPEHTAPCPTSAKAIAATYDEAARSLLAAVGTKWTDATLKVEDDMYGERWTRAATLTALIVHEIHHRGQATVLMRKAGLVVPSIYGPNREETAAMAR